MLALCLRNYKIQANRKDMLAVRHKCFLIQVMALFLEEILARG